METERAEFGVARTECDCRACDANCLFIPGALIPADLNRIAEYLNESDLTRFAFDNQLASPGAIIFSVGEMIRVRTLVPARRAEGVGSIPPAGNLAARARLRLWMCGTEGGAALKTRRAIERAATERNRFSQFNSSSIKVSNTMINTMSCTPSEAISAINAL